MNEIDKNKSLEALKQKLTSLTQPVVNTGDITFYDLFNIEEIQKIQDTFSEATGVASIITDIDGKPITRTSNFCRLCNVIRETQKGRENCYHSDAEIGKYNPSGPIVQPCLSGSLWDAGASIRVGSKHVANWLIGQVIDDNADIEKMMDYAREIGADEKEYYNALKEVKKMPVAQFRKVAETLFLISNQLSLLAMQKLQIERDLHESEEKFKIIGNSIRAGIVMFDNEGNISVWNKGAEKIFGYNQEEATLKKVIELIFPERFYDDYLKIFKEFPKKCKELAGDKDLELVALRRNGEEFPVEVSLSLVNIRSIWHTAGVLRDITERKKVEEELLKNHRELEETYKELKSAQATILQREKMASIGQLAAGVAHEINNPIGFVSGNIRALSKYIDKMEEFINSQCEIIERLNVKEVITEIEFKKKKLKLDYIKEDIKDLIKESLDGTERVSKIVQNLKTFSRLDEASYKEADINECIESTLNIVWNELKYKAEVKKEYGSIPKIKCYPQELNQVFMNLLVNASQAIEKFGEIIIKTWHDEKNIYISVSDTGSGIPEEVKNRIFEHFFTTKDVGKGTGLGLSISYDIIKKHNGEITVFSEIGKGSTFTVKIPAV